MFANKLYLMLSAALISTPPFALPLSAHAASSPKIEDPSKARPLGILISPFAANTITTVPDVYSTSPIQPKDTQSVIIPNQAPPPLGLLITPLPTPSIPQTAPITNPKQSRPTLIKSTTVPLVYQGSNVSPDRPLGLLMNTSIFTPIAQPTPNAAQLNAPQDRVITQHPISAPAWNQQGKTNNRPLGNLLIPGSYKPVQHQVTPALTSTPSPTFNSPVPVSQHSTDEPPVDFSADEMSFDRESGVVSAQGNVEIRYKERRLNADIVSYNRDTNVVSAEGNVVIFEPTSETIYGEKIEITGDLRDGFILNIGVILQDNARIAGSSASRTNASRTEIKNAVYSPCDLCKDEPNKPPIWQIKAVKVTHNKATQTIEYRDAWIEFFGFPVFYTPYFRHPDPTVKRKSGFLFPTLGGSSDLGTTLQTPYFLNLGPHEDATITPIVMTQKAPVLSAEYRKRAQKGEVVVSASLTSNSDETNGLGTERGRHGVRGHIQSTGRFDINQAWRWGFDGNWTTDDTYMRRYGFGGPSSLESQLFAESFKSRSYFSAKMNTFQSLQDGVDSGEIPLVLPLVDFNYVGKKDRIGGSTNFDFNLLSLTRDEGTDTRRLSARSVWQRPLVGALGDIYNISFGLNTDLYHVDGLSRGVDKSDYTGFSYRVTPEAAFEWRMPFAKSDGEISHLIEPIATFMWSPYGGNSDKIPNEDSIELEFDDTNLFRTNRFSGLDRVEGGPRLIYGLKWGAFKESGGKSSVFIGQSWRPKKDDTYATGSGLEDNFSDIVARMEISPGEHLKAIYRTRFDSSNLSPKRNEIGLIAGIPKFRVTGNYIYMESQRDSEFSGREELDLTATSQLNRHWRSGFNATRDMDSSEMRTAGMYLTYEDECVVFTTRLNRTFFEDRDLEPTDSFTFNLVLKTLGEVHTGGNLSN